MFDARGASQSTKLLVKHCPTNTQNSKVIDVYGKEVVWMLLWRRSVGVNEALWGIYVHMLILSHTLRLAVTLGT